MPYYIPYFACCVNPKFRQKKYPAVRKVFLKLKLFYFASKDNNF